MAANGEYPLDGDMNFFFWNDSSDLGSEYNKLSTKPQMAPATFLSATVSADTGEQTIGSFVTEPFPAGTVMGPGLTRYRTYLNVSSAVGVTTYNFIPYNLSADGIETRLFYGVPRTEEVNNIQDSTEYLTSYSRRNYTYFNVGDRLLIRVNVSTSSVVDRTAYFNIAGTDEASMVQVGYWISEPLTPAPTIPNLPAPPIVPPVLDIGFVTIVATLTFLLLILLGRWGVI